MDHEQPTGWVRRLFRIGSVGLAAVFIACGQADQVPTRSSKLDGKAVALGERAIFYGAESEDSAGGLAVGDFNGDGSLDLALSAGLADGPDNERPDGGEIYLFLGPFQPGEVRDAAVGDQDVTVYGASAGDQAGRALAAGDLNGDGFDDLAIGALFADGPDEGRRDAGEVYVIFGSADLPHLVDLAESDDHTVIFGADAEDLAGFAVGMADVNGDELADLIVGAFWADGPDNARPRAGEAYVMFGEERPPSIVDLAAGDGDVVIFGAEAEDRLGEALGSGDVNGDEIQDLLLPAPFASGPNNAREEAGETYIVFGSDSLPATIDLAADQSDVTILGIDPGDQVGHSLASGDINGDGFDDVVLGAVSADGPANGRELAGEAYLVLGGSSLQTVVDLGANEGAMISYGADSGDRLGRTVAVGDLNGDKRRDLLLAAPGGGGREGRPAAGKVFIVFGGNAVPVMIDLATADADLAIVGDDRRDILAHNSFGRLSLLAVDMNGDGLDDVVVSAPNGDGPGNERRDAGEAYVVFVEES